MGAETNTIQPTQRKMRNGRGALAVVLLFLGVGVPLAMSHVFVSSDFKKGPNPRYDGSGWIGEAFLNIPVPDPPGFPDQGTLFFAEDYIEGRFPDFTFKTDWIDFPPGPQALAFDGDYYTIGEFLGDNVSDVSDPDMLDEPFGHFLLRFSGYLKVEFNDDTSSMGLPVWVDFGTLGYDGYRLVVGETIYRFPLVTSDGFFWRENPILEAVGLHRIVFTYFNRYDPLDEYGYPFAGVELYTWHGGGLAWPTGQRMVHPERGPATIIPPRVIYQLIDIRPSIYGDFDADGDVDAADHCWFQSCFTGPGEDEQVFLKIGCDEYDFDGDRDVDVDDYFVFESLIRGPR